MSRSRASAKAAGSRHERVIADYLAEHVSRFVDRMPKYGAKDRGDIGNVETFNQLPVAVEAKDYGGRLEAGAWLKEARRNGSTLGPSRVLSSPNAAASQHQGGRSSSWKLTI